eukprot:gene9837-biopygen15329
MRSATKTILLSRASVENGLEPGWYRRFVLAVSHDRTYAEAASDGCTPDRSLTVGGRRRRGAYRRLHV